jgi:acyl-CoA dehydrogenase
VDAAVFAEVLAGTRRFVRERVVPLEAEIDEKDEIPEDIRQAAKQMGLFGFALPEEHGGLGLSMAEEVQLVFELGYTTPALRSMFGTNNGIAGHVLMLGGTLEQQRHWLPRIASGEVTVAFALTEPEAGSDPSTLTTKAARDGDDWVTSGAKRYTAKQLGP